MRRMRLFSGNEEGQRIEERSKLTIGKQPIIHRLKHAVPYFERLETSLILKKWKMPRNLTIITCHNYKNIPLFEKCLRLHMILDYVVLFEKRNPWKGTYKIENIYHFLTKKYKSMGVRKTPYVLYCDASDVIIKKDLFKVMDAFESLECDLVFGSTMSGRGWSRKSKVWEWNHVIAKKRNRYLNAGVCMGKWDFMTEVFEEAIKYIDIDNRIVEREVLDRYGIEASEVEKHYPDPYERNSDQDILRAIHPLFWPDMSIDYFNDLIYRN